MKLASLNWVRLPIDNIENCRELGGYYTKYDQQTKWRSFIRSSNMSHLDKEDMAFLKDYGVKTVIDLRSEDEIAMHQNPLSNEEFCQYFNIPFTTNHFTHHAHTQNDISVGDFYIDLLEQEDTIKAIFDTIAQADEGCIVFHCVLGKDRTGVLAMLLLGLAGVDKKDIISNYETSYSNLESLHGREMLYDIIPKSFLYSDRNYILRAYEFIIKNYQSFEQYLIEKGVERDTIERVKYRLVGVEEVILH